MTYDAIYRGRDRSKKHSRDHSNSVIMSCKYCEKSHNRGNCPAFGENCQKCGRDNHFKSVYKSGNTRDSSQSRAKKSKGHKGKKFHGVTEDQNGSMDDLADQVQSLF